MIRIHIGYRPVDVPWGGANNFIRALRAELERAGGYLFTDSMSEDCDILFMNQLSTGPGAQTKFERVRRFRDGRSRLFDRVRSRKSPMAARLVVRAVNLSRHAFRMGPRNWLIGGRIDRQVLKLLNFADFVIFQSAYQKAFFSLQGYRGTRNLIIHNGADPAFWSELPSAPVSRRVLHIASSTASPRATKRHDLIARLSEMPEVDVRHFGNWPDDVNPRNVRRHGMVTKDEMARAYGQCDYFFHPAVKDPCPNAIFEAICSGLPVIYNSGPGSSGEIVGPNGFALDEGSLLDTVATARARLPELKDAVIRNRAYYTIRRATGQYRKVFDTVATEIHNR